MRSLKLAYGPHLDNDLETVRADHGLSPAGAVRTGLNWMFDWWTTFGPDEPCWFTPGAHLRHVTVIPSTPFETDRYSDHLGHLHIPVDDTGLFVAQVLADLADMPVQDLVRYAVCATRTVLDHPTAAMLNTDMCRTVNAP